MLNFNFVLAALSLALSSAHVLAEEQAPVNTQEQAGSVEVSSSNKKAEPSTRNLISIDGNLELKKAGSHGMLGTRVAVAIQPVERHRLKLYTAYFNNDRGAASDSNDTSFGLSDFFACLFGSCPDEDYSNHTGGNYFYEYVEKAAVYQYQLSRTKTGDHSYGEVWVGAGPSQTERTSKRYQLNNGDNYDIIDKTKDSGVAWAMDFVSRHDHWYWQASLSGSTSSESFGGALGVGVGF